MVYFQSKNPNLCKFGRVLEWKMLIHFIDICNILRTFGIFYDQLVNFMTNWYILCSFGTFCVHFVHFVHFFRFWYHALRKIWQPWLEDVESEAHEKLNEHSKFCKRRIRFKPLQYWKKLSR
jgi:hypothetical protein